MLKRIVIPVILFIVVLFSLSLNCMNALLAPTRLMIILLSLPLIILASWCIVKIDK
jgi:hypothetical protein